MLATEILTNDHNEALTLIGELEDRHNNERGNRDIFRDLDMALRVHMRIEEKIFYPALERDPEFKGIMAESVPEHDEARSFLDGMEALNNPASDEFQALLTKLRTAVNQHAEKEEADIFPRALATLGPDRVAELGNRIDQIKGESGMTRTANM